MDPVIVVRTVGLMLIAYLAGSIPVGVLVARAAGGVDPRTIGSGRTGGTNALRALGPRWAAVVVAGDLLKGALPVILARIVTGDPLVEVLCGGVGGGRRDLVRVRRVPERPRGRDGRRARCSSSSPSRCSWRPRSSSS